MPATLNPQRATRICRNAMIVVVAAFSANADVYWFVGESGASWQDVNNYRLGSRSGSVPTSLPGGSDLVMAGSTSSSNPTTVEVSAEDIDFVAALKGVSVRNCRLTLNVATNSHFSCAIAGMSDTGGFSRSGTVVKQGAGDMYLDSVNSYIASGRPADYLCDTFCVSNGNVYLLKDTVSTLRRDRHSICRRPSFRSVSTSAASPATATSQPMALSPTRSTSIPRATAFSAGASVATRNRSFAATATRSRRSPAMPATPTRGF